VLRFLYSGAIRFKFHDRINQRPINFQSATPGTARGDEHFYAFWWFARLCPIRIKRPRSTQRAYFWSHARLVNQRVQNVRGSRLTSCFILYFLHAQRRVQKVRGSRLTSCFILYFLHVQCCIQKARHAWFMSHFILYFLHAQHHVQKARAPD
jgi:hypothetical protein